MNERLQVGDRVGSTAAAGSRLPGPARTATSFVVQIEHLTGGVPVVSVAGEIDLTTAAVLDQALAGPSYDAAGAVIVDLGRCTFIDLRGLRVLLAARERMEPSNRPLALVIPNPSLLRIFQVIDVTDRFEIYPSLAAAEKVNGRG